AVFYHVGVWMWAGPPDTGNYVPVDEAAPPGLSEGRITNEIGFKCETSYTIDTSEDQSFYDAARIVEDHVTGLENFNRNKKPRRNWQDLHNEYARKRFILSARLFIYKTPYNSKEGQLYHAPYKLHPWVDAGLRAQKDPEWIPNPDKPSIADYIDGNINILKPTTYQYFSKGDIVRFSFVVVFGIQTNYWQPDFKPLEFVRVGRITGSSENRVEHSVEDEVEAAYQSLTAGNVVLLEGVLSFVQCNFRGSHLFFFEDLEDEGSRTCLFLLLLPYTNIREPRRSHTRYVLVDMSAFSC
ncbi:hypothetical protein C8R43DRAFT_883382, partial [Mycena crocata]